MVPIISIVGKSKSGKTTLIEKLIPELKSRGYRVATIKRDAHRFEMDKPGKDTYRHYHAGAEAVLISSSEKMALIQRTEGEEIPLDELAKKLPKVDIILTEGFRMGDKPKIEVHRQELNRGLLCTEEELICVATDEMLNINVPLFDLDDAAGIVDILEKKYLK